MYSVPFKKLVLASAVAALTLSAGAANAHVSYNLANDPGTGAAPADGDNANWTAGAPSGYVGNLPINWFAHIHNGGGVANSQTASSADSIADGGAGIAVGARAYKDNSTNWGHNADFALFTLEHDATVTITVSSDNSSLRSAFGLWSGWDTASGSRHGTYLSNGAINPMANNPFSGGDAGISVVDANAWAFAATQGTPLASTSATLTRFLTAGNYTLALGGYDGSVAGQLAYTATITAAASPVPVPGAVWLFGSAMAGFVGLGKRKRTA